MRPYKASNDVTKDCWHGLFFWAGAWLAVRDAAGQPIRFATWRDAKHAAVLEDRAALGAKS